MSDQEINIAIAEACGWRQSERNIAHWHHVSEPYSHILTGDLPNYCNDLNAMHEAENWMIANKSLMNFWKYADNLKRYFSNLGDDGCIHATARQRAEAFLRTIGKWEEEVN